MLLGVLGPVFDGGREEVGDAIKIVNGRLIRCALKSFIGGKSLEASESKLFKIEVNENTRNYEWSL